jgi:hypothetical protein
MQASGSVQEAKNRISRKTRNVAEVSKVQPDIQNNSRKSKSVAGKFKRSAERWAFRRKFETAAEQLKKSAEKLFCSWKSSASAGNSNFRPEHEYLRRRFELPREHLDFRRNVEGASRRSKSSAEE